MIGEILRIFFKNNYAHYNIPQTIVILDLNEYIYLHDSETGTKDSVCPVHIPKLRSLLVLSVFPELILTKDFRKE
jgi:hypothetical protein